VRRRDVAPRVDGGGTQRRVIAEHVAVQHRKDLLEDPRLMAVPPSDPAQERDEPPGQAGRALGVAVVREQLCEQPRGLGGACGGGRLDRVQNLTDRPVDGALPVHPVEEVLGGPLPGQHIERRAHRRVAVAEEPEHCPEQDGDARQHRRGVVLRERFKDAGGPEPRVVAPVAC